MPKSERQKLKLLYLLDDLRNNTDAAHPMQATVLLEHLAARGIQAERKSLYDDIRVLEEYGIPICRKRGRNGGYYVESRTFALPELKLLVDAVLSSRFLTPRQSMALIRKLAALSSTHEAELLRRQIVLAGRPKTDSDEGFRNIDVLQEAISANSQISFRYFDWGVDRQKHFRPQTYLASPYALLWDDENYYLIAHSARHGLTHYRVDKMEQICLTGTPRTVTEETRQFDPAAYSREVFGMYRGERQRIKLRFENELAGVVIDRFGRNIMLLPEDAAHFTLTTEISLSPNFMGWLTSFSGRAAILFPPQAIQAYRDFCYKALASIPQAQQTCD